MGSRGWRIALVLVAALGLLGWVLAAPAAGAARTADLSGPSLLTKTVDHLSPRLTALSEPALRDATVRRQATVVGLPASGPTSIPRGSDGSLRVEILVGDTSGSAVEILRESGAQILHVSTRYSTITANVLTADLRSVGSAPGVLTVAEVLTPQVGRSAASVGSVAAGLPATGSASTCGVLVSDASSQLMAATARARFSVDGAGLKVGVLSNSFNAGVQPTVPTNASQDVASGALPGPGNPCGYLKPVQVLAEGPAPGTDDEGRAMLQEVHGVAPGAELMFATGVVSKTSMADNIFALATAGAKIIADDIQFPEEPMFQDGIIANAVTAVVASGVSYFSAAMNNNAILPGTTNNVASWETPAYRPMACPASVNAIIGLPTPTCMDFATSGPADNTAGFTLAPGASITPVLQWAVPQSGSALAAQFFYMVVDPNSSDAILALGGPAFPGVPAAIGSGYTNPPQLGVDKQVAVAIGRLDSGTDALRLKYVMTDDGAFQPTAVEYPVSAGGDIVGPSIFGHNGTAAAMTTAAVPYNSTTTPEPFSNRGPNTLYFEPVSGGTPSASLAAPQVLAKPDFTATDGVCTTMLEVPFATGLGPSCPYRFYGTSATGPNAAGVTALLLQAVPGLTPAQVRTVLASTASPISGGSLYSTGAGLINANAAIASVYSVGSIPLPPAQPQTQPQTAGSPLPKRIKHRGLTQILPKGTLSNAGQALRIRANARLRGDAKLFKLITRKNGRVLIRTYGYRIRLTLIQSAPATVGYDALTTIKRYKL